MPNSKSPDLTDRYLGQLTQGARGSTQQNAKELRYRETEAERKLWALLRNRQLKGQKFRRQHPIADYVVDFYCNECKLVIELDGNFHTAADAAEYDNSRTLLLNRIGITVLRFWNAEVMSDPVKVLQKISQHLK